MRISSSEIQLSASHAVEQTYVRRETLVEGVTGDDGVFAPGELRNERRVARSSEQSAPFREGSRLLDSFVPDDLAEMGESMLAGLESLMAKIRSLDGDLGRFAPSLYEIQAGNGASDVATDELEATPEDRAKMELIVSVVERLTGKRMKLLDPGEYLRSREQAEAATSVDAERYAKAAAGGVETGEGSEPRAGEYGFIYRLQEREYESERTAFSAQGIVRTADGEEIAIDVSLTMSREFLREQEIEVRGGAALKDPLIINFEGTAAELSARRYAFDIDSDGQDDQIRFAGPGGGFLALDKNGDGTINNGSELFGPRTGSGFGELATYDEDGNGFIDAGDSVFERLRIFTRDDAGNDRLVALGAKGIGAIYLGHASTPFEVKNESNEPEAVVRSSGIYLREGGGTGTVQQVDFVV